VENFSRLWKAFFAGDVIKKANNSNARGSTLHRVICFRRWQIGKSVENLPVFSMESRDFLIIISRGPE
jgi:hypothetical protein